ncbi:hypothetical protein [Porphyromonas catoniae]|uniref:hypothetical protein n=1 Tax=Porphyromonas catoniae TaxID=41976 RepID=UPI0023F4EB29|nr:hypothetical protein [Porphyromonas catoniae]
MKKVLMMLCSLLLLACSKEDIPQSERKQTTPVTAELDISADWSRFRALDFKLKNGKVALDLGDKTEIPVWTAIYRKGNNKAIYSKLLMWQIDKDDRTQIHYRGPITLHAEDVPLGSPNLQYTLAAAIVPEDAKEYYWEVNGVGKGHRLGWREPNGDKLRPISETEKVSISAPYLMETKLDVVPDPKYSGRRPKLLYTNSQPASVRRFKPRGVFLRFKIQNKFNHEVTIEKVRNYYNLYSSGMLAHGTSIEIAATWPKGQSPFPAMNDKYLDPLPPLRDFEFDVPGGSITIPANGESNETFLIYMPEVSKRYMQLYRMNLIPSPETTFQDAYYTALMLTKDADTYVSGKVYDVKLALKPLPNPITLISKFPLDKTGDKFVENTTGNYDDTFSSVGYYLFDDAEARFARPKLYANGGTNQKWYMPTSDELHLIFADYSSHTGAVAERIQIGTSLFWGNIFSKEYHNATGKFRDVYALRFCKITEEQAKKGLFTDTGLHQVYESAYKLSHALTDNGMRYAFRYYYDEVKKLLTIKAKYIGEDPNIRTVDDIQDRDFYGGKIDWSTVSETFTIPLYGTELAHGQLHNPSRSPAYPHNGWMCWPTDAFIDGSTGGPVAAPYAELVFFSPMGIQYDDRGLGTYLERIFMFGTKPDTRVPSQNLFRFSYLPGGPNIPRNYIKAPVYLFKQLD